MLAVLVEGGSADTLELASCQSRLENVGRVDRPFSRTCTDQSVHFVNHQNHVTRRADFVHDFFEAFFKFAPVFRPRNQQADVEGNDALFFEDVWDIVVSNALGEAFGDRGFADSGFPDQHRVIFGAATQDLNYPFDFFLASDYWV